MGGAARIMERFDPERYLVEAYRVTHSLLVPHHVFAPA